ncbi:MAG: peptidoglycan-associated lipoprotein Pal, partial [Nitrospirota bacterium]
MKRFLVVALILSFAAFGCAQKEAVKQTDDTQQQQAVQSGQEKADSAKKDGEKPNGQQTAKVESKDMHPDASGKVEEISDMFDDIHFDFDKYDIKESGKPALKKVADYLIKNNNTKLLVEGHCDDRGTNEYNLGLGDRRAKSTKDYLSASGVKASRIEVISFGEEKPLCNEQNEGCWAKNRRAHFVILKGK